MKAKLKEIEGLVDVLRIDCALKTSDVDIDKRLYDIGQSVFKAMDYLISLQSESKDVGEKVKCRYCGELKNKVATNCENCYNLSHISTPQSNNTEQEKKGFDLSAYNIIYEALAKIRLMQDGWSGNQVDAMKLICDTALNKVDNTISENQSAEEFMESKGWKISDLVCYEDNGRDKHPILILQLMEEFGSLYANQHSTQSITELIEKSNEMNRSMTGLKMLMAQRNYKTAKLHLNLLMNSSNKFIQDLKNLNL